MEVSKPQPDSAENSIDDNFDDFGFKFLCDDIESSKSTLSSTSNSSLSESACYAGNVKPINGFWVIKESPSIRSLKEPRLSSRNGQKAGSYSGKTELKSGYGKNTQYVPAGPHFRHFMEHTFQSSNIGRKVYETQFGVHEEKESICIKKQLTGELKVRESPNLEVVYDTNKTCTQGSARMSNSFEFQAMESLAENSKVHAGSSEQRMETVKAEPEGTREINIHNYSWQISPRDPKNNEELPEKDGRVSHKGPMKYSPRDPRIRISHDQKVPIPPCKIEVQDIKKYSPRDPRIKRFHATERPNIGQSSEDNHVSVSCNLPNPKKSEDGSQRATENAEWEEEASQGQGNKYETLESQKTDKENDGTYIAGSFQDHNQSLSLTKLKISRVAHHRNMYVSSFCQEYSPRTSEEKVDDGLKAENGGPPSSIEKGDVAFEAENELRMAIERQKHDLSSDICKFNEKTERITKLGEKYCQAKVVVRKLQDLDIHKQTKAVVAISNVHKKGKRTGPRLRKELVLFSKNIPTKMIEVEGKSYQYAILQSDYITSAIKPNKSDLLGDELIQSSKPGKGVISDKAIFSTDGAKEEIHSDQRTRELLVHGESAFTGNLVQENPEDLKATSPDQDTLNCIENPHIGLNDSIEEENQRCYDTLSTEYSLLPSAQCPNDDEKDLERASINNSEDVEINIFKQKSEMNTRILSQFETEMGEHAPVKEFLAEKDPGIIDNSNIVCLTQKMEEHEIDLGECLEKETQCARWQISGNISKEVQTTKTEQSSGENHESEIKAGSPKDVDHSHKVDIVKEIKTAFQVSEKQVEADIEMPIKEQNNLHTPALSFLLHNEDPMLQDSSTQKSNKRHHLELDIDGPLWQTGGGGLDDMSNLEIISTDQVSVVEQLPYKKLRTNGDNIRKQELEKEVAIIPQSASKSYTTTDKKIGFYRKKYNRKKLKLPIGMKYLKNQCNDGEICTSTSISSRANLNASKEQSLYELTPTKEITLIEKPHSPEDTTSPVFDPVVAIEKLRYKLFAEAGVDLSKPSSSMYSGRFQRKLKKISENEFQQGNKTNFPNSSCILKFENTSRLNIEKQNDPGSQPCVKEKVCLSRNVYEKGHIDAVKKVDEVQCLGNAHSPKALQIDYKTCHYQRKYNSVDAGKAEVPIEKRKLSEKKREQIKRAKISLLAQKLTLRSVSKTTRVGYSKDGFIEKTIIRKEKPDEAEWHINASCDDKTREQLFPGNMETRKDRSVKKISRNNFAQVKKGKRKLVSDNCSKEHASINIKNIPLPTGAQTFEESSSKSCIEHISESNCSSMELNDHSKINELEGAENRKWPDELKEPNCIKTEDSDNMGKAESVILVNIKTDIVDTGAHECDKKEQCKVIDDSNEKSSDKTESMPDPRKHSKPKQRPAKCVVCGHVFKTKELLKKHHPCRIKQTRTWSQKALRSRPNRVRKEPLPVVENKSKTSKKPRLLAGSMAHKKSKFKVLKGKTRRKVLQAIRELMEKRKPSHLPQMHILCEQLPENEQFLFQLGLLRKEKTLVGDLTCHSPSASAEIARADAVAVVNLKTSHNYFHGTKLEEGYVCEDEKSFPPILEKISSEFSEELSPLLTLTSTVEIPECLDPPVLEPILAPETISANQDSLVISIIRNVTSDSPSAKQLAERHFTDFIEEMPKTITEKIDVLKEKGPTECILSAASFSKMKSMIKAVKSPYHSMTRSIRRHFTDAISDKEISSSVSETVSPLHEDVAKNVCLREIPSGEITVADIKNVLTLEREREFSKHSLIELNKDLAALLTTVTSKSGYAKNESSDDKHKNNSERINTVTNVRSLTVSFSPIEELSNFEKIHSFFETQCKETCLSLEKSSIGINDPRDPTTSAHLEEMGKFRVTDQENLSKTCIIDNIIRMISSLEDTGNFAENMKDVLQLLTANLGIQFSEIIQGRNLNKEQEERLQSNMQNFVTAAVYRSEYDEQSSDLQAVGHSTANGSEPSPVSFVTERGSKPEKALDQEVPEDSFVECEKFNRAGDIDIDRGIVLNANYNKEDSLVEQVFDLLKNMVDRVEKKEIESEKFVDDILKRQIVTFMHTAGNNSNLNLLHQMSDIEKKDGKIILSSEAQFQNDPEDGREGIAVFESLHAKLDDSKLVSKGRNEVDSISFTTFDQSESDNPGHGVKEKQSVNDRTENSKEDRCLPERELEFLPITVVDSKSHSKESEVRCASTMEMNKTQDKVCILKCEYQCRDVFVHENTYLDKEYSAFQIMDGSEQFFEKPDLQSSNLLSHAKVKERWCPLTGYALESDDTNEDLVAESGNNCQNKASLSKKEQTGGHYNEACRRSEDGDSKVVIISDLSGFQSTTVSNNEASINENTIFQADQAAIDSFIKCQSFNHNSVIEPISDVDSELNQMKNSVASIKSEPSLNVVKHYSMDRTQEAESRNMSKSGFFSRSEETCYENCTTLMDENYTTLMDENYTTLMDENYTTLMENHARSSDKFKKIEEEKDIDQEVFFSSSIEQDILKAKNMPLFKTDEHSVNTGNTHEVFHFDMQKDKRDEWYLKEQDLTNLDQLKILHDQQMNRLSNTDKGPAEVDVDGDYQNVSLVDKIYKHTTNNSSCVEYKSVKASYDDNKEDYFTKPIDSKVAAVCSSACEAGHENMCQIMEERNLIRIPLGIGLEVEKDNPMIVKGIVSFDEKVSASVTGIIHNYSENNNEDDSKSSSAWETNSDQTVNVSKSGQLDATLHTSDFQLELGERSSLLAPKNVIIGEYPIGRGNHGMESDTIVKADYVECGLNLSSEESNHQKVLDEYVENDHFIIDDCQSGQSLSPTFEPSSKHITIIASTSVITPTEATSYCSKNTLGYDVKQNANIDKESVEDSGKADTFVNEVSCCESKRQFNETVLEGTGSDFKGDKEALPFLKDIDKMEAKSISSFTCGGFVTSRYEEEAESFHAKCKTPEEFKNNEQREVSADRSGDVKELITYLENGNDQISSCDQQSFQRALRSEKILTCINIISEDEISEINQPRVAQELLSSSLTNQDETGRARDAAQQTQEIDSVASTIHYEKDEILTFFVGSDKMCSLFSGDTSVQSHGVKESEHYCYDDKGEIVLNDQVETSKETITKNEAQTKKHKSYISLGQDSLVSEDSLGQSSDAFKDDFNHAFPSIDSYGENLHVDSYGENLHVDSYGENLHVDLNLHQGMEQVDASVNSCIDLCKDVPNSIYRPLKHDSVKSDVSEEVNNSSDIISYSKLIGEECHHTASSSAVTEFRSGVKYEHLNQTETTLSDSLKNEKEFSLSNISKLPTQMNIIESEAIDPEVGNAKYKLNKSNSVDETVVEMENTTIHE